MATSATLSRPLVARNYRTSAGVTIRPGVTVRATTPAYVGGVLCRAFWTADGEKYLASALAFKNAQR